MGFLRIFLALSVIIAHSGNSIFIKGLPMYGFGGRTSVGLFYIISGFYMAMIITEKYSQSLKSFYVNRLLRILPSYWFVLLLGAIFIYDDFHNIYNNIQVLNLPARLYFYFSNLFILGSDTAFLVSADWNGLHWNPYGLSEYHNGSRLLLNEPIFTVGIELLFYAICPLMIKKTRNTIIFLALGIIYHFWIIGANHNNVIFQYHLFPSSLLYFSLGILSYKMYKKQEFVLDNKLYIGALVFAISVLFIQPTLPNLFILIFPIVVPVLFHLTKNNKIDRFIGDLSYPLYIVHFPVLKYIWSVGVLPGKIALYVSLISIAIALIIHLLIEKPIDKWRHKLR